MSDLVAVLASVATVSLVSFADTVFAGLKKSLLKQVAMAFLTSIVCA